MKLLTISILMVMALSATPITNLHNTGLAPQLSVDPNWTINGGVAYVTQDGPGVVFPFNFWIPDSSTSAWISPQPTYTGGFGADPGGVYDFGTTFNLAAGFDPAHTSITFSAAADNLLVDVKLNGVSIGHVFPNTTNFTFEPPVTIGSGFDAGLNHLDFYVNNVPQLLGNPTGIQVVFGSDVEPLSVPTPEVPEPVSELLMAGGLIGIALIKKKANFKA